MTSVPMTAREHRAYRAALDTVLDGQTTIDEAEEAGPAQPETVPRPQPGG